jgi:hypothetical protein
MLMCMMGTSADELSGVDVACAPLGKDKIKLMRDRDDTLRFIWGQKTWTVSDNGECKVTRDWYRFDASQDKRRRETECAFGCSIDWSVPPTLVVN